MAKIILDGKEKKIGKLPSNGAMLAKMLGVSSQEALMRLDGKIRPLGSKIGEKNKIEIIRVVFGG